MAAVFRPAPLALLLTCTALSPSLLITGAHAQQALPAVEVTAPAPALTQPDAAASRAALESIPGAVAVVEDDAWADTQATTLKDVLDFVPGVFVQPKWGEDARLSIRGSGLSRNFHLRGIGLYVDGIPISFADGSGDFQEIDPTAFDHVQVYKGASALSFGNSTLGGAINFVSPSGRDAPLPRLAFNAGSFGFRRFQAAAGTAIGAVDGHVSASAQSSEGYRAHSDGSAARASANLGIRLAEGIETRFYAFGADIQQDIPGSVSRQSALGSPRAPNPTNVALDYERNIRSWRLANRTVADFGATDVSLAGYVVAKDLVHPIFQYLEYGYLDYGVSGRVTDERGIAGLDNRFLVGLDWRRGLVDNRQYVNLPGGRRGALLSGSEDRAETWTVTLENDLEVLPGLHAIAGVAFVSTEREREDEIPAPPNTSGGISYDFWNPKGGLLWQATPEIQLYGSVARTTEAPSFGELNFTNAVLARTEAQEALTVEIGSRGQRPGLTWDVALYRAWIDDEFQFFDLGGGNFQVTNADQTVHQGLELGVGWDVLSVIRPADPNGSSLWLNGAYTFSDFFFDGDPVWGDNELPGAPRHQLRAELVWRDAAGWQAGPNLEWVPGAGFVDNANTVETRSYALLGFRAGWDVPGGVHLFLDARNLTDEAYIASASVAARATPATPLFEPGTGRALFAGASVRW